MRTALQNNRFSEVLPATLGQVDSLFDQFFGPDAVRPLTAWRAPATIWDADDKFHIEVDVPGVIHENVELTFDKGSLNISLERPAPDANRRNLHNERVFGKVTRRFALPETADPESITAELNAGVLHVTVAKLPQSQPKKIEIKTA